MDRVRSIATRRVVQPLLSWCANFASLPYYINGRKHRQKQEHKYNRSTPLTVGFVTHQTNGGGVFSQYFPAVGFLSKMLKELIQFSETFLQARTSWKSRTIELWRLANWQIDQPGENNYLEQIIAWCIATIVWLITINKFAKKIGEKL